MGPVVACRIRIAAIDLLELSHAPGECVSYPSGKPAEFLSYKELDPVCPAFPEGKFRVKETAHDEVSSVHIIDLIPHIFVENFNGRLKQVFLQVSEISERYLI